MAKQRKRPGWALFIDRMKREQRYHLFREIYDRLLEEGDTQKNASYKACVEMGYEGPDKEREVQADWLQIQEQQLAKEEKKQEKQRLEEERAPARLQKEQLDLIDELGEYDINESDLPEDIAWVFHNLHKCKGEVDEWLVVPDQAPTPGAWSMVVWAVGNQTKFMELVIREQMKINTNKDEDKTMKATNHTIDQIEEMLANI
jgi:hypothetical protein|tara:strand:+ start:91 stop:696 length:606 start_codon:yes stop_codon:yes gene_type:complete